MHFLYYGLYNLQYKTFFKYIVGCTTHNVFKKKLCCKLYKTRNIKLFLNILWVVQPAMYLKKKLCCKLYNVLLWYNGDYHINLTPG